MKRIVTLIVFMLMAMLATVPAYADLAAIGGPESGNSWYQMFQADGSSLYKMGVFVEGDTFEEEAGVPFLQYDNINNEWIPATDWIALTFSDYVYYAYTTIPGDTFRFTLTFDSSSAVDVQLSFVFWEQGQSNPTATLAVLDSSVPAWDIVELTDPEEVQVVLNAITAAVPIPAGVWLLGSGLIGLLGIRRRLL